MRKVNLAVIGWGGRGGSVAHIAQLASGGLMRATACMEPSDERYALGCREFGISPTRYASIPEMLAGDPKLSLRERRLPQLATEKGKQRHMVYRKGDPRF